MFEYFLILILYELSSDKAQNAALIGCTCPPRRLSRLYLHQLPNQSLAYNVVSCMKVDNRYFKITDNCQCPGLMIDHDVLCVYDDDDFVCALHCSGER